MDHLVNALESGNWRQARGRLWRLEGGVKCYCATGVATQLFLPHHPCLHTNPRASNPQSVGRIPPLELYDYLPEALVGALIDWNDSGFTFATISTMIRNEQWMS